MMRPLRIATGAAVLLAVATAACDSVPGAAGGFANEGPAAVAAVVVAKPVVPTAGRPVLWGYVDGAGMAHFASRQVDSRYSQVLKETDGPRVFGKKQGPEHLLTWLEFSPDVQAVQPLLQLLAVILEVGRPDRQHPGELGHDRLVVEDVLEDLGADHPVEGPVREGELEGIALHGGDPRRVEVDLPRLRPGPEGRPDLDDLVPAGVQGHDGGPPAGELVGVAPEAAAEVEDEVTGLHAQDVEVSGQHQSKATELGRGSPARMDR